ncbi:MAG TPA: hypothetical protein VFR81_13060 [Longimicrobium sp.]|nr:hypothetical protein [Longimicrobium sp.]
MKRTIVCLAVLALAGCDGSPTGAVPGGARFDGVMGSGMGAAASENGYLGSGNQGGEEETGGDARTQDTGLVGPSGGRAEDGAAIIGTGARAEESVMGTGARTDTGWLGSGGGTAASDTTGRGGGMIGSGT